MTRYGFRSPAAVDKEWSRALFLVMVQAISWNCYIPPSDGENKNEPVSLAALGIAVQSVE